MVRRAPFSMVAWPISLDTIYRLTPVSERECMARQAHALSSALVLAGGLHVVTNMAIAAAAMITAVAQPRIFKIGEFTRLPITFFELVSNTTRTISGAASTPFSTADQNNIFTASIPK